MCLDGLVGAGQDLQAVVGVLVCAGVVTGHSETMDPVGKEAVHRGGMPTLNGPATLSAARGWRRSVGRPRRSTWGDDDGDKRRWKVVLRCVALSCVVWCCVVLCCVVLCCVVLCWLCCVVLCCVVLGCVVLGCVVLVVLRCVVLCCVVKCCVVLCWLCCGVVCSGTRERCVGTA